MVKTKPKIFSLPLTMWPSYSQNISDHVFQHRNLFTLMQSIFKNRNVDEIRSTISRAANSPVIQTILARQNEINGALSRWKMIFLSAFVRLKKPGVVVETGVAHGSSSAIILEGLSENYFGTLYSIDKPKVVSQSSAETTIPSLDKLGWLVPGSLRDRWKLILGDSLVELPPLLQRLSKIDIFLHDSLHTYEHMTNEFEIAWPFLKEDGVILSDDIFVENHSAIHEFSQRKRRSFKNFLQMGIIKKGDGKF